jgi:hypothetical protein
VISLFHIKSPPVEANRRPSTDAATPETDEEACPAFGYLEPVMNLLLQPPTIPGVS